MVSAMVLEASVLAAPCARAQRSAGAGASVLATPQLSGRVVRPAAGLLGRQVVLKAARPQPRRLHAAVDSDAAAASSPASSTANDDEWVIKYLYDGDCSLCRSNKAMLERQPAGRTKIKYVNIQGRDFDPEDNEGVEFEDAMDTIHAIRRSGEIIKGPDALLELYEVAGIGWAGRLGTLPVVSAIVEALYQVVNKLRLPVGGAFDAVLAARKMAKVEAGVEHCVDDEEECAAPEW